MATPSLTQAAVSIPTSTPTGNVHSISFGSATSAGSMIVVTIQTQGSSTYTFTATDNQSNVYSLAQTGGFQVPDAAGQVLYCLAPTAGVTTVSVTASGSNLCHIAAYEVTITSPSLTGVGEYQAGATSNAHECMDTGGGGLAIAADSFTCCSSRFVGTVTSMTAGSGYTKLGTPVQFFTQYQCNAGAISADYGAFTSSGTARAEQAFMASFASGGAAPTFVPQVIMVL